MSRATAFVLLGQLEIVALAVHPNGDAADTGPGVEPRPERPERAVVRGHRASYEAERRVRRDPAPEHDPSRPDLLGRPDGLRCEDVDDGVLEPPRELRDDLVGERAALALIGSRPSLGLVTV